MSVLKELFIMGDIVFGTYLHWYLNYYLIHKELVMIIVINHLILNVSLGKLRCSCSVKSC